MQSLETDFLYTIPVLNLERRKCTYTRKSLSLLKLPGQNVCMAQDPPFVTSIDVSLAKKLRQGLEERGFTLSKPQYTIFSAKKKGCSCTLYESGKLLVQGKEKAELIQFYLEPEILQEFTYDYSSSDVDFTARIGIDESGKGDFFGPLCIAGVFASDQEITQLLTLGVKDSKSMRDPLIQKLAKEIQKLCQYEVVIITPKKYNELYKQFGNLNHLLAWGHATTIENLVQKSGCQRVTVDQFADKRVVERALARKNLKVDLSQRHRAESDVVVAAASILARDAFLKGLERLEKRYKQSLPKGASTKTILSGKQLLSKYGEESLLECAKLHFKTLDAILGKPTK